jgi:hypothetical protein
VWWRFGHVESGRVYNGHVLLKMFSIEVAEMNQVLPGNAGVDALVCTMRVGLFQELNHVIAFCLQGIQSVQGETVANEGRLYLLK